MSSNELAAEAMALPLADKVSLAQALWESINAGLADTTSDAAIRDATCRDQEISSGTVGSRTHDKVMQAARRAIGCG